jgi:large subunit ribosomal protein L35
MFLEEKMPKLKSHSGAKKRFFMTGSGKIKRKKPFARHILTDKSSKRIRHLRKSGGLNTVDTKRIKTVLPYL